VSDSNDGDLIQTTLYAVLRQIAGRSPVNDQLAATVLIPLHGSTDSRLMSQYIKRVNDEVYEFGGRRIARYFKKVL